MPKELKFYDVKSRKSFTTGNYAIKVKVTNGKAGKRKVTMGVAKRNGREVYRIIKNEKA